MKAYYNRDYSQKEFYKHSPITVYFNHIRTYVKAPTVMELSQVIPRVKLMITRYYYHLFEIL